MHRWRAIGLGLVVLLGLWMAWIHYQDAGYVHDMMKLEKLWMIPTTLERMDREREYQIGTLREEVQGLRNDLKQQCPALGKR